MKLTTIIALAAAVFLIAHGLVWIVIAAAAIWALRRLVWEAKIFSWRWKLTDPKDRMEAQLLMQRYRASMRARK